MARKRGTRTCIRESVDCPSCGAGAGQYCVAYVPKPGKTTGRATADVHAARWRAWFASIGTLVH